MTFPVAVLSEDDDGVDTELADVDVVGKAVVSEAVGTVVVDAAGGEPVAFVVDDAGSEAWVRVSFSADVDATAFCDLSLTSCCFPEGTVVAEGTDVAGAFEAGAGVSSKCAGEEQVMRVKSLLNPRRTRFNLDFEAAAPPCPAAFPSGF